MIFDSIQNKENYRDMPLVYQALCYLSNVTKETCLAQTTVLIPDILFCNPVSFTSKPEEDCVYEAHRRYMDLHYILTGVEGIATADVTTLKVRESYDKSKDIGFYEGPEDGRYYLKPGQFMICWPNDAHKVAMMQGAPSPIQKIVFKIKVEE